MFLHSTKVKVSYIVVRPGMPTIRGQSIEMEYGKLPEWLAGHTNYAITSIRMA